MKTLRFVNTAFLALGLVLFQRTANAQVVTTLAGSGASGSADGNGAAASFWHPSSLAVDSLGNVYVGDTDNNKIRKITPSGTVTTLAGSGNKGSADGKGASASFRFPRGIAVDFSGNVYVTEESFWSYAGGSDADIRRVSPDGEVTTVAALPVVMFASGVTVTISGDVYLADGGDVTDVGRGQILKIAPDGRVTTVAGDSTAYPVSNPAGIAADRSGHLYVTDSGTGSLLKLIPGVSSTVLAGNLKGPAGVAIDSLGNVYVAEAGRHRIQKVGADGTVTTVAGSGIAGNSDGTGTAASFNYPSGVALDDLGNLYVADTRNNTIRKIALPGAKQRPNLTGVLDVSVWPDGTTCFLRFDEGTGRTSLDALDKARSFTAGNPFGPYEGWTPRASATGLDGLTRVLWNNRDGSAALWLTAPGGNQASFRLGPVGGATATDVAAAVAGITHLLWTYVDGRIALWSVDNTGRVSTGPAYGPFPGWTAVAAADGQDGLSRILWSKSDGSTGLWFLGSEGLAASAAFGPVSGWMAADIAVGADGLTRILWTHHDGRMALWSVDSAGNRSNSSPMYMPPPGFAAVRIAAGSDGLTRVLLKSAGGGALLWILSADNVLQESFLLRIQGPYRVSGT